MAAVLREPDWVLATQLHSNSEGIIVHQLGHLFFLISMAILIFTINGKELTGGRGWKRIQYSAFLFILWNLDAVCAHFLDNQIHAVSLSLLGDSQVTITARDGSSILAWAYYFPKLDHLLCVPAIWLFYRGLADILASEKPKATSGGRP